MARELFANVATRQTWAERISESWQTQVESIFETGHLLIRARGDLDETGERGDWSAMVREELPFGIRTAQCLIAIVEDDRLANHGSLLPASWRTLYELTKLTDDELAHLVAEGILNPEMERAEIRAAFKVERRAAKEAALAEKITALPGQKFGVIYADPEWEFETWGPGGMDRAAANHYPTSPLDVIAEREVASIAAPDCVLFLWATVPMLPQALHVMERWGFVYKSHWVWLKDEEGPGGTGYWSRNAHEILLIGTVGDVPAPLQGTQPRSVIFHPVAEHSAKPAAFAELIEQYYPNLPKIELNARGPGRPGWHVWGNEAGGEAA